ncbi:MAG: hypothetical protein P1V36_01780 [Planctomycetota bacterium]|nr:hypothetical protein [Planctomycetota bacterium]
MSDTAVKSCPFCGSNVAGRRSSWANGHCGEMGYQQIECSGCGARGPLTAPVDGDPEDMWAQRYEPVKVTVIPATHSLAEDLSKAREAMGYIDPGKTFADAITELRNEAAGLRIDLGRAAFNRDASVKAATLLTARIKAEMDDLRAKTSFCEEVVEGLTQKKGVILAFDALDRVVNVVHRDVLGACEKFVDVAVRAQDLGGDDARNLL